MCHGEDKYTSEIGERTGADLCIYGTRIYHRAVLQISGGKEGLVWTIDYPHEKKKRKNWIPTSP